MMPVTLKEIADATGRVLIVLFGSVGLALVGGLFGYLIHQLAPAGISVLAPPGSPVMAQEELHMVICGAAIGLCLGLVALGRRR